MKEIYEENRWYNVLHFLANRYIRGSFKKIRYNGMENIPRDGAVILSPNHCDALMDPLAVFAKDCKKMVFVARADLFNKPKLAKVLTFLKIMPIHRIRDGFRNVLNSENTIEKSIEVLNNQVPFCILPEGAHRPMHSLLPMGKGLARVAYGAYKRLEGKAHVYIVPTGCEYGDYFRYRSTLLVTFGKAMDVSAYIEEHPEKSEPEVLNDIRKFTAEAMKKDIVYIPDDDDYEAVWELCKLRSGSIPECRLEERLRSNQQTAGKLAKLREEMPDKAKKLFEKAVGLAAARKKAKVSIHSTNTKHPLLSALWNTLKFLICLPFALAWGIASLPAWAVAEKLASGVKDRAFRNSFRCVTLFLVWTLLLLIEAIVLFCTLRWYLALAAVVLLAPAPMLTYDFFELSRRLASSWRYLFDSKLRKQKEALSNELNEAL